MSFEFAADEAGATFACSLDGGAYAPCSSPASYNALAEGLHTFAVKAIDGAGNADESPASSGWTVDTTAPGTVIALGPSARTTATAASFEFAADEAGATLACSLDGGAFAACNSPVSYDTLGEGPHTFAVRATDDVGNTDPTPATHSWTIDLTPPVTAITSGPGTATNETVAVFAFAADEPGASFTCSLDGAVAAACSSPVSYDALAEGPHTFAVTATDDLGNTDATPAAYGWAVDLTRPDTVIAAGPSARTNATAASFEFAGDEAGATFACSLEGGAFAACSSPASFDALAEGPHTFAVRAIDRAGNTDETPATSAWTIDTTAPDTVIASGPSARTAATAASFEFAADEAGATLSCSLDGGAYAPCSSPASYDSLSEGPHTFAVRAADDLGNTDATPATHGWTVDLTPPVTAITSGPGTATHETVAVFAFTADEAASFSCSLDGAGAVACSSPALYSDLTEGAHTLAVTATDEAGNTDATPETYGWTIDTTPPETAITSGPKASTAATNAEFVFSSSETETTFECQLDGAPFAACTVPVTYGELLLGGHTFSVRSVDAVGNVDLTPATFSWDVVAAILMAAGDIACRPGALVTATTCRQQATSDLLMNEPELTHVLALGDLQYEDGCYADFVGAGAYHDTWGRKLAITKPVPGNHEYHDPTPCPPVASGYFQYFGAAAGDPAKGYYSFDLGPWHLIALSSEIPHGATSAQVAWLKADLAAATQPCVLAYWHRPRFSSGHHGSALPRAALWDALYDAGADLVLSGHDHDYERFAPQDKAGQRDAINGVTQFVVGTGGSSLRAFSSTIHPSSEARNATTFGVLKLTLGVSSYEWEFVPEAGATFTDSGSAACH